MRLDRCKTGDVAASLASRSGSARVSSPARCPLARAPDSLTRCEPRWLDAALQLQAQSPRVSCYARRRLRGHPRLPIEIANCASLREHCSFGGNDRRVVSPGLLDRSLLRRVINVHETEALGVAVRPLVIVEQRPGVIAAQVHALAYSVMRGAQMLTVILDAQRVLDLAVDRLRRIVKRGAVLRYVDRAARALS